MGNELHCAASHDALTQNQQHVLHNIITTTPGAAETSKGAAVRLGFCQCASGFVEFQEMQCCAIPALAHLNHAFFPSLRRAVFHSEACT